MTATNHIVTGALIATALHNPLVAVPVAFLSHFAMDCLPHFGKKTYKTVEFVQLLVADVFLASVLLLILIIARPDHWLLLIACGIVAASPDLMWIAKFIHKVKTGEAFPKPKYLITRFHHFIQWGERPWGMAIELPWFAIFLTLLAIRTHL